MTFRGAKGRHLAAGRVSDSRIAWTKNSLVGLVIRYFQPETNGDKVDAETGLLMRDTQIGPNVRVEMKPAQGYKVMGFDLTQLTLEELVAFRQVMNLAFDLAEPVVKDRDEAAKHEDPSVSTNSRIYRALPELAVREGAFAPYVQGVRDGSEDASGGSGGVDAVDGGVRGSGASLASAESEDPGPSYYSSEGY